MSASTPHESLAQASQLLARVQRPYWSAVAHAAGMITSLEVKTVQNAVLHDITKPLANILKKSRRER
jgi:hypothetical protein